ncbi:MAG: hypothetical protein GC161_18115 [Planctomycetaceae bacterium]|nr:hypothetical protein [Planctomycetaceae bacterium]
MNKALSIGLTAVGGLAFFTVSFLAFARLSGVPLHKVAVVGPILIPLLGIEPPSDEPQTPTGPAPKEFGSAQEVVRASVGALGAFSLPPPFEREGLQRLSDELKAKRAESDRRAEALAAKERDLADQLARLEHMSLDLSRLRDEFEAREAALELRAQEVQRDESAKDEAEAARWGKLGRLLAGLEPKDAGQRLLQHSPEDAARILGSLEPAKAAQILMALPKESWAAYSDAYAGLAD